MGCSLSSKKAVGAVEPTIRASGAAALPILLVVAKPEEKKPISANEFKEKVFATNPQTVPLQVKALTYNLQWWSLYDQRNGNNGSATALIAAAAPDVMGMQECNDVTRVMIEGGLHADYTAVQGPHSLAIAFKRAEWELAGEGHAVVAVDMEEQFFSSRSVMWVRLVHKESKKTIFFVNHHGPLRVNSGGRHGGPATAENIVRSIHCNAMPGDGVIMVGTFNAQVGSQTIRELEGYLPRASTGVAQDGVDHFFSQLQMLGEENLGNGGSDHDALAATFVA
mmetsp:Transcript_46986/g.125691  ORF Transcript_46986/g.125691 Transcript_46986/m.125691 type:complete len:280 (-) Transcript_46986:383-1222(-)